jgi:predicted GIY-YIG superfamily endonuclease
VRARASRTSPPGARPLRALPAAEIARRLEKALAAGDGAAGAHCIHELWCRGEFAANIEAALDELWRRAGASVPDWLPMRYIDWLPAAYEVALGFKAARSGRHNLYLILLDYPDRRRGPYGVYIGMSQYSPAQRFDQHKAGIRAAGSVLRRGLEVLTGPTLHLQHMARSEAVRIEAQLAEALRDAGLLVEGGH